MTTPMTKEALAELRNRCIGASETGSNVVLFPHEMDALLDALESEKTLNQHLDLALGKEEGVNAALRRNIEELQSRAESAEQALLLERQKSAGVVMLPRFSHVPDHPFANRGAYIFSEFRNNVIKECAEAIRASGITILIQGGE
ncbi:MAG: hypothetical protein ACRCWW_14290 [Scandinavium sp.]|uniref:hypothetical protein n=1 Tax=Scandinavium sp. TaxID=2830653 RepID=UPI003F2A155F